MKKIILFTFALLACLTVTAQTGKKSPQKHKVQSSTAVTQNLKKQIVGLWTISQTDVKTGVKTDLYLQFESSGAFVQSSNTKQGKVNITFKAPGTWQAKGTTVAVKFKPEQITLDMQGLPETQQQSLASARRTMKQQFRRNNYLSFRNCQIKGNKLTYINTANKSVTLTRVK